MTGTDRKVLVLKGDNMAAYGFGDGHPFGPDRHDVFHAELERSGIAAQVELRSAGPASAGDLGAFHTPDYLAFVTERCQLGSGFLDAGDTPARAGLDAAAAAVVGASIEAMEAVMAGQVRRAFVPIAGLHHAGRAHAAGFCVYNDCGIVIELLRSRHGLRRIAYVDIDAHHGDGVFYGFEHDPDLLFADIHEDGRSLYPGTGHAHESGAGAAAGTKLNIPLAPGAGDAEFRIAWERIETYLEAGEPEFIILQCGADSIGGDPITHLQLTPDAHEYAAGRLCGIADRCCDGRLIGLGGGGYNRENLALAWTAVVRALVENS
ncbi:MAG: acetoin utilization protein AcuC [Gammaproteobacteria bacterium]|nr:MAG: acetoin utilization protein AcuC [Gammaproteobacteria bacterium]